MHFTARQITEITGGTMNGVSAAGEIIAAGITWDSREVAQGDLYVCLPGERVDGHDFAAAAAQNGASVILAMRDLGEKDEATISAFGAAIVQVADTAAAIIDLASAWRAHLTGTVIAVTGSSGKTTTKNLIRDVLSSQMSVVATKANQNNELGVPRTILVADEDTQAVVVEIGMRGAGQIEALCKTVRPDFGIITNVGESHIELLGSRENIARAKGELISALPAGGTAFLNAHDDFTDFIIGDARPVERGVNVVLYDGSPVPAARARVFATDIALDGQGRPSFTLHTREGSAACALSLRGAHNVDNACAAAAIAAALGMDAATIASALSGAEAMVGRQDILITDTGVTVVDDAYNANPDSMRASLAMFETLEVPGCRIAVLGDMGELGSFAPEGHARVGALAAACPLDRLVCVGTLARGIAAGAREAGMPADAIDEVDSVEGALAVLEGRLQKGDAVLVKASHSMGLEQVVKGLMR